MKKIEIFDSQDIPRPQDRVVAQALASRSIKPFREHLDEINEDKTATFYDKNVIGFGHDNINACGDGIIVSLPEVSILAAKYIEDSPLFNGQESSTRYIDFSKQPCIAETPEARGVVEYCVGFFNKLYEFELEKNIERLQPKNDSDSRAVKAYTLDVMRCLIPAGLTTNVNWVTNLRQVQDHAHYLMSFELQEIQDVGHKVFMELSRKYPGIISPYKHDTVEHMATYADEYQALSTTPTYYYTSQYKGYDPLHQKLNVIYIENDLDNIRNYTSLKHRPRGCSLPRIYSSQFCVSGHMDFGSFRDLQRHRNGLCKIPRLNTYLGFENAYLARMSEETQRRVIDHLEFVEEQFEKYKDPYIVLLGYKLAFNYQCSFEQLVYIAELRSSKHVHFTCRPTALHIGSFIKKKLPDVALYLDEAPLDHFSFNRGSHTITKA